MEIAIRDIEAFKVIFNRLVRRASRLKLPEPTFEILGTRSEKAVVYELDESISGEQTTREVGVEDVVVSDLRINNIEPIKLPGWKFIAYLEHSTKGAIAFTSPFFKGSIPDSVISTCRCDHCNLKITRSKTFVVQNEAGEFKQVGSSCLQDFIGHNSADQIAHQFEYFGSVYKVLSEYSDLERAGWHGGRGDKAYDLKTVVAKALFNIEKFGWVSKAKDLINCTYSKVLLTDEKDVPEIHFEDADKLIEFISTEITASERQNSQFLNNIVILAQCRFCTKKSLGIACAFLVAKNKLLSDRIRTEKRATLIEQSRYLGSPKERLSLEATVAHVAYFDTDFGTQTRTILHTDDNCVVVCNQLLVETKEVDYKQQAEVGQRVSFKGTVKEHKEYDQVKQTILLRPTNGKVLY